MRGVAASSVAVEVFAVGSGGGGGRGSVPAPSVAGRRRALQPRVSQGFGGRGAPVRVVLEHWHEEVGEGRGLKVVFFKVFFLKL